MEAEEQVKRELPHLYGWKWYSWAKKFYDSRNQMNFLCAANQISKSTTAIRKCVDWATDKRKWTELWREPPTQFWYLYPTKDVVVIEFETKWKKILPRGEMKSHPIYGWREEWRNKYLFAIHFNSGVHVYFKTYAQDEAHLQSGTCDAIFCDEELPIHHLDELLKRLTATDGYFHMVFTATLGQDEWRRTIEPDTVAEEMYKDALKIQVSMFDCLYYEDGTKSFWTPEKIAREIALCSTKAQVQRRIYGKFAVDSGLTYEQFDRTRNMRPKLPTDDFIGNGWNIYGGADNGSGGEKNHPGAVSFIAVDPTFRQGIVFSAWRGDGITTTAGDIVNKFLELRGNMSLNCQLYDQSSKDFDTIASGLGETFTKSDKTHTTGEDVVNVLFKNQMLWLYEGDPEIEKLAAELTTLKKNTPKPKAKDDLCDTVRYQCCEIPWDFSFIQGRVSSGAKPQPTAPTEEEKRRNLATGHLTPEEQEERRMHAEFEEWNELYGS